MNLKYATVVMAILFTSTGAFAQTIDVGGTVDLSPDAYMLSQTTRTQLQERLQTATTTQQRNQVRAEIRNNIQEMQARPEIPAGFNEMFTEPERNMFQSQLQVATTTQQRNQVRLEIATLARDRYQSMMKAKYGASLDKHSKKSKKSLQVSSSNIGFLDKAKNFFSISRNLDKQGGSQSSGGTGSGGGGAGSGGGGNSGSGSGSGSGGGGGGGGGGNGR
jgi:hypothetical protein